MSAGCCKGLVVAGTHSGCGKTTVTLALLAALRRRGLRAAPFKAGPDFIDPGHHSQVSGRASRNLDGWMLCRDACREVFARAAQDSDIAVVEGVMGLFDGVDGTSEDGSTAQMAKWLGLPVLLVADARSMARSAAALVAGFEGFDPELSFCGVAFNRVGSQRHRLMLEQALSGRVKMPCRGALPRREDLAIAERHLGLVTREDHALGEGDAARLADWIEESLDLDGLISALPSVPLPPAPPAPEMEADQAPVRIAVARDRAFCFYYQDNLDLLMRFGAEIVFFSPLDDPALPAGIQGLYLGGGYPELHAAALAENASLRALIRQRFLDGMPVYAECGGFMYLCRSLCGTDGREHPMAGCFDFGCTMSPRLRSLGYRDVEMRRDTILGKAGTRVRGHEFHYSHLTDPPSQADGSGPCRLLNREGKETEPAAFSERQCLAGYVHLHFLSNPSVAGSFVESCREYGRRNGGSGEA
ncbi:MAG: cobyrinate a,c-diamide synthase [Thermodesulfobacteriota bacterium]